MIYVITGPTCLGKSETALFLAKKLNTEIVNGDAFQCYKELNIGVAKPSDEFLKQVRHHLYSFLDTDYDYSIAEYQKNLRDKLDELLKTHKDVVLVGGSGLYIRSALFDYEFEESKKVDMSKYLEMDNRTLHDELVKIDPQDAEKIHMNNRKRMLRAIEIYLSSGKSKSDIISTQSHKPIYDVRFFVRDLDRDELYRRINERVDKMIEDGLFDEAKSLLTKYPHSLHSLQAIGYKEFILVIKGEKTLADAVEQIKQNTRNYAKRQMTFIRHQFNVEFYKDDGDLWRKING